MQRLSNGQTSQVQQSVDYTIYSVYRPGQFKEGEKLPLIVWGDGTCDGPKPTDRSSATSHRTASSSWRPTRVG